MKVVSILVLSLLIIATSAQAEDYTAIVQNLIDNMHNVSGPFHHAAYNRLAYLSDTYGPRLWGSAALEKAIQEVYKMAHDVGFDNIRLQAVKNFTKWVRVNEELYLHDPRPVVTPLKLIGLGGSVSGHVKAEAIVVSNYTQLENRKDQVKGKIVVYDIKWTNYGQSVAYRSSGASRASQYGAVGALVHSITPDSVSSVHAGIQHYDSRFPKIPFAAITKQDSEMLHRMQKRGQKIVLELILQNYLVPNTYSNNVVFQIRGSQRPEEILLMGGHIDSWDTGSQTGANDDAGGFLTCFEAMRLIKLSNLRPKRTIRFIAWSGQEWGDSKKGAFQYVLAHKQQLHNHIVAFQDDLGSTKFLGVGFSGNDTGRNIVKSVANQYLSMIDSAVVEDDGTAVDTGPLFDVGIPVMKNVVQDTPDHKFYFTYHHSAGDSMTMMNADDLDSNVLGVAIMFYVLADMENSIPKPTIKMEKLNEIIAMLEKN